MARKLTATQKLRSNVKRTIRNLEKKGYSVPQELKHKVESGGYQTLKSIQRNRYKKLYEQASHEYNGELLTGTEYKKLAKTLPETKYVVEEPYYAPPEIPDAMAFYEGEIVYQNISELIEQYPDKGSIMLSNVLHHEIQQYGLDNVLRNMSEAPSEAIELAQNIIYYVEDSTKIHSALVEFVNIIRGTKATDEEAKELGDALDELTDM